MFFFIYFFEYRYAIEKGFSARVGARNKAYLNEGEKMKRTNTKYTKVTYSIKDGINFYLGDESIAVLLIVNAITNKRTVFVNNKEIAQQFGLSALGRKFQKKFDYLGHNYEVELVTESFISGRLRCTLIKDETHFATTRFDASNWEVEKKGLARVLKESLFGGLVGAISGYAIATLFIV